MAFFMPKPSRKESKSYVLSFIISWTLSAHRFSPTGYPDGVETVFSLKINTFSDRRKEAEEDDRAHPQGKGPAARLGDPRGLRRRQRGHGASAAVLRRLYEPPVYPYPL